MSLCCRNRAHIDYSTNTDGNFVFYDFIAKRLGQEIATMIEASHAQLCDLLLPDNRKAAMQWKNSNDYVEARQTALSQSVEDQLKCFESLIDDNKIKQTMQTARADGSLFNISVPLAQALLQNQGIQVDFVVGEWNDHSVKAKSIEMLRLPQQALGGWIIVENKSDNAINLDITKPTEEVNGNIAPEPEKSAKASKKSVKPKTKGSAKTQKNNESQDSTGASDHVCDFPLRRTPLVPIQIPQSSIDTLRNSEWLDDTVVTASLAEAVLHARGGKLADSIFVFDSLYSSKEKVADHEAKFSKGLNESIKTVFVPVHVNRNHWFVCMIVGLHTSSPRCYVMDSLPESGSKMADIASLAQLLSKRCSTHNKKNKDGFTAILQSATHLTVPKQNDTTECGVHVIANVGWALRVLIGDDNADFVKGAKAPKQNDTTALRDKLLQYWTLWWKLHKQLTEIKQLITVPLVLDEGQFSAEQLNRVRALRRIRASVRASRADFDLHSLSTLSPQT